MKTTPKPKFKKCENCNNGWVRTYDIDNGWGNTVCLECNGKGKIKVKPTVEDIHGSPGSNKPLPKHHKLKDFRKGYKPHVMCLVGAMCSECRDNLVKPTKEKKCNHKWQIIHIQPYIIYSNGINGSGGANTGNLIAVCTECLEKRYI